MRSAGKAAVWGVSLLFLAAFTWGGARISDVKTSRKIHLAERTPVDPAETFPADIPAVYCTAKITKAPEGSTVKADFFYMEGEDPQKIAHLEVPNVSGTRRVAFHVEKPASGWPAGRYRAVVWLSPKLKEEIYFSVAGKEKPPQAAEKPAPPAHALYTSPEYGFSLEYPVTWREGPRVSTAVACLFLANPLNNPVCNLNVQVIQVSTGEVAQPREAVDAVAKQFLGQISGGGAAQAQDRWIESEKMPGREISFHYPFDGKTLKQRQFLTYKGGKVYALIYTAEESVYDDFLKAYDRALKSFSFPEN